MKSHRAFSRQQPPPRSNTKPKRLAANASSASNQQAPSGEDSRVTGTASYFPPNPAGPDGGFLCMLYRACYWTTATAGLTPSRKRNSIHANRLFQVGCPQASRHPGIPTCEDPPRLPGESSQASRPWSGVGSKFRPFVAREPNDLAGKRRGFAGDGDSQLFPLESGRPGWRVSVEAVPSMLLDDRDCWPHTITKEELNPCEQTVSRWVSPGPSWVSPGPSWVSPGTGTGTPSGSRPRVTDPLWRQRESTSIAHSFSVPVTPRTWSRRINFHEPSSGSCGFSRMTGHSW